MCQYSAAEGYASDWHLVHLGSRAVGGAGLVMLETTAVERDGRISHWDLGIWDDDHIPRLKQIATFLHDHGAVPAIQIGHAGRKASQRRPWEGGGPLAPDEQPWTTIAPSAIPFDDGWPTPDAMSPDDIERVNEAFRRSTNRAVRAGFQVLEIHAAHGYLLNQFLAEQSNERTDAYGGAMSNRLRFTFDVVEAVRSEWPDEFPLFVRISATDWTADGWGIEESITLAEGLRDRGVDVIDVSAGGAVPVPAIRQSPGYQVPFSEDIRRRAQIPTVAVGLLTDADHAERILADGQADIVALGREFLRNPYWPLGAADALNAAMPWPPQYERAKPT